MTTPQISIQLYETPFQYVGIEVRSVLLQTIVRAAEVLRELGEEPDQSVLGLQSVWVFREVARIAYCRASERAASSCRTTRPATTTSGAEIIRLGRIAERRVALYSKAEQYLRLATDRTSESSAFYIRRDSCGLILIGVDGPHPMRFAVNVGESAGLHAGAGCKALLAYLSTTEIDQVLSKELQKYTENTICDPVELRADITRIRKRGWSFSEGEVTSGTRAVGAPVFDASGSIRGSISVTSPAERMPDDQIERFANVIVETTVALSSELGWTPATSGGNSARPGLCYHAGVSGHDC